MEQIIYVDVLLLINLFVNYLLLLAAHALMHMRVKRVRVLLSSCIGALYSLIIFLPDINIALSVIFRLAASLAMIITAFGRLTPKLFIRAYACFFLSGFAFAGIMLGVWLAFKPDAMLYNNGAVYFDIDASILVITAVVAYLIMLIISRVSKRNAPDSHIVKLTVSLNGAQVSAPALFDTGNTLCENFSGYPVIICEYGFIKNVLDKKLCEALQNSSSLSGELATAAGLRFVSYNSVGAQGLLTAFRPDFAQVNDRGRETKSSHVYIAVYNENLSGGEYRALVGNRFFELSEKGEKGIERAAGSSKKVFSEK